MRQALNNSKLMATSPTITKILFRRGLDIVRRTGGGTGVVLNAGEPGFCIDTYRLYVGDGTRVGGRPVGVKNHGIFSSVYGSCYGYTESVYQSLTSNGVDVGDIFFDNSSNVMFYVSANDYPSANAPPTSALARYPLIGQIAAYNGLSADRQFSLARFSLDYNYFSVDPGTGVGIFADTAIGTALTHHNFTVYGNETITNTLVVGDAISTTAGLSTIGDAHIGGNIYAPDMLNGHNSVQWAAAWSLSNSMSGVWNSLRTTVSQLTPFPWVADTPTNAILSTYNTNTTVGINTYNSSVVGLIIKGADTTTTALSVRGGVEVTGDVIAFTTSDARLKKDVLIIENALDTVKKIDGVKFNWNCDYRTGPDVGVIAQQVEAVYPDAVSTREGGIKAVNYEKLIPLLIQAIKELAAK